MSFPQRTRIKFCGITRVEDAALAVALGVDAVGFVLVSKSPRYLTLETAAAIRAALPPLVNVVTLFINAETDFVEQAQAMLKPNVLQFHGDETAAYCERFATPYMKAMNMGSETSLAQQAARYPSAAALLLDSHAPGGMGGTGQRFDWSQIESVPQPLVLAGGLNADNVGEAIHRIHPYAVDVSSGIELRPGIKCPEKMRAFVQAVRAADRELNS